MSDNKLTNIQVYRKKWNINIGVIIFGVIFIYLVITVLTYVTAKHISVYEVREGSILKDTSYTGIIIREEEVVSAQGSGYVNFFVTEGSKVGKKTNVYSLSDEKIDFSSTETSVDENGNSIETELTSEEKNSIETKAQNFIESFSDLKYEDVYTLKDSVNNIITANSAQGRQAQLNSMIQSGQTGLNVYPAEEDGIILYSVDGYESLTAEIVTKEDLSRTDYEKIEMYNNTQIDSGNPVYKLVTSEDWTIVIELDDEMNEELKESTSVKVRFAYDGQTTWAGLSIKDIDGTHLAFLTFDHSMVRYAGERFLDIELILEDESGLKIPTSSVIQKDFYIVPEDYLTQGGNSKSTGVLIQEESDTTRFEAVTVYYRDQDTGMIYLNPSDFDRETILVKPDSSETYTLKERERLPGVYNVNKGYAVFCQVNILCESDEYYIVEEGSDYGLSNYDHIALDGNIVHENDIVF